MKFIQIAEGLSVEVDKIESVSRGKDDELTSLIRTHHNIYKSTYPYSVLLELLERNQDIEPEDRAKEEGLKILKQIGTFAG